jgi:hypothetical protein
MAQPIRILLQTTLLSSDVDDWTIARFSLLQDYLASLTDDQGQPLCAVIGRDREPNGNGDDPILSSLSRDHFDELWLFALDVGGGLSEKDQAGITDFYRQGGGILTTRDHQDMGISMCGCCLGSYHYFQSNNLDPDPSRQQIDDPYTTTISWPNYHSGRNGDYQEIKPTKPIHELLKNPNSPTGMIRYFPAHPHEGGVGTPPTAENARVIAVGESKVTGREFNLAVVDEEPGFGRVVAESTFHHFVDYNWDISKGCPSFVEEPPGDGMATNPQALEDIKTYVKNIVLWLQPVSVTSDQ